MAKEKDWLEEEYGCFNCGDVEYKPSRVEGLCQECFAEEAKVESPYENA